jgi:hypothetical protein
MNNMKLLTLLFSLVLLNGCANQPHVLQNKSAAQILIERPENNGFINIFPCTVKISAGKKIALHGGENESLFVKTGTYFLMASSLNPYPDATKNSDWKSSPLKITVTNSQVIKIIIEPKSEGSTYTGGWVLTVSNP